MIPLLTLHLATLAVGAHTAAAATLEDAWSEAETHASELVIVKEQRVQTDQATTSAWAMLSPKLTLGGNYTLNQRETAFDPSKLFPTDVTDMIEQFTGEPLDMGDPLVINKKHYLDANLTISQPLFSAQTLPYLRSAQATRRAGRANEDAARAQIRLGVARVYWGALVARDGEKVAQEGVELAKQQAGIAAALVDAGQATEQTRLQAKIAVARAERDLLAAHARASTANEALQRYTSLDAATHLDVPVAPTLPFSTAEEALTASADRPEFLAADNQARAARLQAATADLGWLPRLDGRFIESWSQNTGFNGENTNWMLTLNSTWTLWDGGARIADSNRAHSAARMTEANADNLRETVRGEVVSAWTEYQRATAALASATEERGYAEENVRLANVSLAAGTISFVDAEAAALGLSAAKLTERSEQMAADLAARALLVAVGR